MVKSDWRSRISDLLIGVTGSVIAAGVLFLGQKFSTYSWVLAALAFSVNFVLFIYYRYHYRFAASRLSTIQSLTGLIKIDQSLQDGETPQKCMRQATTSLKFMGIGAQKWSGHEQEMREMLSRLGRVRGRARFLVMDPNSPWAKEASVRSGHKPDWLRERLITSLKQFNTVREQFDNLEVRLYDHYPYYRLVLLNDNLAVVGQYRGVDTSTGWEAPLVHFTNDGNWSFYQGYHVHFEGEWEAAKPVPWDDLI